MKVSSFLFLGAIMALADAKVCQNITIPVNIEARQALFNVGGIDSNPDVTMFVQNHSNILFGNYTAYVLKDYQTVTGTYNISAKYCEPDNNKASEPVIQVLTHGIGFDKSYWDIPYNNFNYSYENIATAAGYCTLAIDRLGIGESSKGDPYQVIQAPAEVAALYQINLMLRKGTLPGVNHAFGNGSIVNVGHSFGSQQSYMLSLMHPEVTDALILTGFSMNNSFINLPSFNPQLARLNQPLRFGNGSISSDPSSRSHLHSGQKSTNDIQKAIQAVTELAAALDLSSSDIQQIFQTTYLGDLIAGAGYGATTATFSSSSSSSSSSSKDPTPPPPPTPQNLPNGYITWSDALANQYNFLYPPGMDAALLPYSEATKQPFTIGEALTLGAVGEVTSFTGPVLVLTGRQDAIYCGGDCLVVGGGGSSSSILDGVKASYPDAANFTTFVPDACGHSMSVHYVARSAYQSAQDWLTEQGIHSR